MQIYAGNVKDLISPMLAINYNMCIKVLIFFCNHEVKRNILGNIEGYKVALWNYQDVETFMGTKGIEKQVYLVIDMELEKIG